MIHFAPATGEAYPPSLPVLRFPFISAPGPTEQSISRLFLREQLRDTFPYLSPCLHGIERFSSVFSYLPTETPCSLVLSPPDFPVSVQRFPSLATSWFRLREGFDFSRPLLVHVPLFLP